MGVRNELLASIAILVFLNAGLCFFSIGLFSRMGPAIDRILDENATSITESGRMLASLAMQGEVREGDGEALRASLERLRNNVTEEAEHAVLNDIDARLSHMDRESVRSELVGDLQKLSHINRGAMENAGARASRLGAAGAWTAVWMGILSAALSFGVLSRLRVRLVAPLEELEATLTDRRAGNMMRRCHAEHGPKRVQALLQGVNEVLDNASNQGQQQPEPIYQAALAQMVELVPKAAAVVEFGGRLLCANGAMLDALAGAHGEVLRTALVRGEVTNFRGLQRERLIDVPGYLCTLEPVQGDPLAEDGDLSEGGDGEADG